jgi:hypothetical protein
VFGVGLTPDEEVAEAVRSYARVMLETLSPWRAEFAYYNLREMAAEADEVLSADSYRRLREIKARYDADEVIVTAHPVRPAR